MRNDNFMLTFSVKRDSQEYLGDNHICFTAYAFNGGFTIEDAHVPTICSNDFDYLYSYRGFITEC